MSTTKALNRQLIFIIHKKPFWQSKVTGNKHRNFNLLLGARPLEAGSFIPPVTRFGHLLMQRIPQISGSPYFKLNVTEYFPDY